MRRASRTSSSEQQQQQQQHGASHLSGGIWLKRQHKQCFGQHATAFAVVSVLQSITTVSVCMLL
jgi:hypothetical protein